MISTIFYIILTALVLVTGYFGFRVRMMRSYKEEYIHLEEFYNKEWTRLLIMTIITAVTAIIGFIVT